MAYEDKNEFDYAEELNDSKKEQEWIQNNI